MRVTVDPVQLMDTAVTLASSAVELADTGSALWSCVGCAMPPEVQRIVEGGVSRIDQLLDGTADRLRAEAADLARRALIAAHDPVTATTADVAPATAVAGGDVVVTGGVGIIGFTADGVPINAPGPAGGAMTVGGYGAPPIDVPARVGDMSIIGGHGSGGYSGPDPMGSVFSNIGGMLNAQIGRQEALVARLEASGDPAAMNAALDGRASIHAEITHGTGLATSRSQLEADEGHTLTIPEIQTLDPLALPAALR